MRLGDKVTFKKDYVKTGNNFDSDLIELLPQDEQDDIYADGYTLVKLKPREHETEMTGIVVGKRNLSLETEFEYMQYSDQGFGNPEDKWESVTSKWESFYLVAINLKGLYKVKPEDLELKLEMFSDPIDFPEESEGAENVIQ